MSNDTALVWSFIQGLLYLILIIVFFVMTTNIGTMTKVLRAILKELKDSNAAFNHKANKTEE